MTSSGGSPELEAARARWVAAVNARDLEAYCDIVTEDVVWLPPAGDVVRGRSGFREWLAPFFDRFEYAFRLLDPRAREAGGWAVEAGGFRSRLRPPGGDWSEHAGSYTLLWRRDGDGPWRIERYVDDTGLRRDAGLSGVRA